MLSSRKKRKVINYINGAVLFIRRKFTTLKDKFLKMETLIRRKKEVKKVKKMINQEDPGFLLIYFVLFISRRRTAREGEPPMGYMCRCGAVDPGQGHKWKRGPTGDFICNNCYTKWTTKLCCPVCGKMYKKQSESESEGEAPVVNEQDNAW